MTKPGRIARAVTVDDVSDLLCIGRRIELARVRKIINKQFVYNTGEEVTWNAIDRDDLLTALEKGKP